MNQSDLKVTGIDFLKQQNEELHHTSEFVTPRLVVRRGQPFVVSLSLSRAHSAGDQLHIHLSVGAQPLQSQETLVIIPVTQSAVAQGWSARIIQTSGQKCEVEVRTAPNAAVGQYSFKVKIGEDYLYSPEDSNIYVLFNPWCEGDGVYLPDEEARKEYVINDTGYIYVGSANDITGKPWNFGQFEENMLDCCLFLLDKKGLKQVARKEPARVARAMAAVVNANDENGVLCGNWSGDYSDGTPPVHWTGSLAILQEYHKSRKPVCYGQCWVFSGVLTTVMRCLGIPTRSVTNFCSAHDTQGNLTIDIYLDQRGQRLDITTDSIWNFHVWNDVWMKRPDLPEGYDGWQALDATPQEKSEGKEQGVSGEWFGVWRLHVKISHVNQPSPHLGVHQCGPSALKAIKNGEVYLAHDTKFVFAEVNADRIIWLVKDPVREPEKMIRLREHRSAVGKNISTKAVGKDMRQDITMEYKFAEGTPEERKAVERALAVSRPDVPFPTTPTVQVGFESRNAVRLGTPVTLCISLSNSSSRDQTISLTASCQLQTYDGKNVATIKVLKQEVTVQAKSSTAVPIEVEAAEYLQHLSVVNDDLLVRVTAVSKTKESSSISVDDATLAFKYPPITVDMPETAKIGEPFTCTYTFKNDIGIAMDNCKLHVEGLGLFRHETFNEGNIRAGGIFRSKVICTPTRSGERKIIAKITSDQINGINAEKSIVIS